MKSVYLCLFFLFITISGIGRPLPILEPNDPQFAWMDSAIEPDFLGWKRKLTWADYARAIEIYRADSRVVRFQIIDNTVFGPASACFNMLAYLCKIYTLPDLDFLYWNQDGPDRTLRGSVPVLTGIRRIGAKNTILFGTVWIFDIENPRGPWNSAIEEINASLPSWQDRENRLFWRGAATDVWSGGDYSLQNWDEHVRGKGVALSMQFPDYIDAAFTKFHPFLTKEGVLGIEQLKNSVRFAKESSIAEHLRYKYQWQPMGIIGNFPRDVWQLYSESVCFRHPYLDEVYWSHLLRAWEHYIPVDISLCDLIEKIDWAREHDEASEQIAKRGRLFAQTYLMPEHIALYCYKVLLRYAVLQGFDPKQSPL